MLSPVRTALYTLLGVTLVFAGASVAGYGPGADLLQELRGTNSAPPPTARAAAETPREPSAQSAGETCKFCGKPCSHCPAPSPKEDIRVNLALASAAYNDKPGADLSKLTFDIKTSWPGFN